MAWNSSDPQAYVSQDAVIDFGQPEIGVLARDLRSRHADDVEFARAAFEHVRDHIRHSWDVQDPHVSITASDTLAHGAGLCFAKAHLLAAILRSQGIPTGFCYQKLADDQGSFMLHGLVAVYLHGRWHRQDPRGNKPGVDAQFSLGEERLAWEVRPELGERDYHNVFRSQPESRRHPPRYGQRSRSLQRRTPQRSVTGRLLPPDPQRRSLAPRPEIVSRATARRASTFRS